SHRQRQSRRHQEPVKRTAIDHMLAISLPDAAPSPCSQRLAMNLRSIRCAVSGSRAPSIGYVVFRVTTRGAAADALLTSSPVILSARFCTGNATHRVWREFGGGGALEP